MGESSGETCTSSFSLLIRSWPGHLCTHHSPCRVTWSHSRSLWGWTTSSLSTIPCTSSTNPATRVSRGWRSARLPKQQQQRVLQPLGSWPLQTPFPQALLYFPEGSHLTPPAEASAGSGVLVSDRLLPFV